MVDFDDYGGFVTAYDQRTTALVTFPVHATDKQWREFFGQVREVWPISVMPVLADRLIQRGMPAECFKAAYQ